MCEKCVFNSIGALDSDELLPRFAFKCAICRYGYNVGADATKTLMAKLVPTTRRKEMECACPDDCGKTYLVTHRPCNYGCFDCAESELVLDLLSIHGHDLVSESEASDSEAAEVDPAINTSRQWGDSEVAPNADATDGDRDHDERGGMEPETQGTRHVFAEEPERLLRELPVGAREDLDERRRRAALLELSLREHVVAEPSQGLGLEGA